MIRTQISLDPKQKRILDMLSTARNKSMAQLIREALDCYLKYNKARQTERAAIVKKLAGAWANSENWKNVDPVKYQHELRREKGI